MSHFTKLLRVAYVRIWWGQFFTLAKSIYANGSVLGIFGENLIFSRPFPSSKSLFFIENYRYKNHKYDKKMVIFEKKIPFPEK